MASATQHYWNRRLDPLEWKKPTASTDRAEWALAYDTFLTPDTEDGIALLGDLDGRRVLELGCGRGYGSVHLAERGADVVGVDVSDRRCEQAAKDIAGLPVDRRIRFCAGRAERLPFADQTFDAVFARDVLMYARPETVAREAWRVLVPGGKAVFIEALAGNPFVSLFRRLTTSSEYRAFTRHLSWNELATLGNPLRLSTVRAHYLASVAAFWFLFVHRSARLHRACLKLLGPLDRRILDRFPGASRVAWRGTALYTRPPAHDAV
ncbi:MAG: class I SAM-dependent methyltransferase [Acidobacteriota bacterium]|nr:class I SAM-dependent methyltransferase [Acidobacteriota bacterium]